jgi:hypothetical protein
MSMEMVIIILVAIVIFMVALFFVKRLGRLAP